MRRLMSRAVSLVATWKFVYHSRLGKSTENLTLFGETVLCFPFFTSTFTAPQRNCIRASCLCWHQGIPLLRLRYGLLDKHRYWFIVGKPARKPKAFTSTMRL